MKRNKFNDQENKTSWGKIILFVILVFLVLCLVFYLLSKDGSIAENILVKNGKEYFNSEDVLKPSAVGECTTISLSKLVSNGYVTNEKAFSNCDKESTYIKVCKLESGDYQYTPFLSCEKTSTSFGEWHTGTEDDLVEDKTDVRFTFIAQEFTQKEKVYYPNSEKDINKVNEYYLAAPNKDFQYSEGSKTASKWYVEKSGTTYWNNGSYSSTQPAGFTTKGEEGTPSTSYSLTKPASASYREITEVTLYRTKTTSTPKVMGYKCFSSKRTDTIIISNIPCMSRDDDATTTLKILYTCDGKNEVDKNTTCSAGTLSDWSPVACTTSATVNCESQKGYKYVDRKWKWYNSGTYRSYYPSGAASADKENTYYVSAPVSGAIQDTTTTTTVNKYYKLVEDKNATGRWMNLSDDYLKENELISLFKKNNYDVNSLEDILKNENIKYSIKMEYANRE